MVIGPISLQWWAITFIQGVFCAIAYDALAAFFIRPARPFSRRLWALLNFLGRTLTILLALSTVLVLEMDRRHGLRDTAQAHDFARLLHPFSSAPLFSLAGREELGGHCFNFTSKTLDHYQVLNLPRDASQDQIRPAYVSLSRACHPDKLKGVSWDAANENYQVLRRAYDDLKDELSRCTYECNELYGTLWRTARERAHCGKCFERRLWSLVGKVPKTAATGAETETKAHKAAAEQGHHDRDDDHVAGQRDDYGDGVDGEGEEAHHLVHARQGGTVSTALRAAIARTSLVLKTYASSALSAARGCLESLRDGVTQKHAPYIVLPMRGCVERFNGSALGTLVPRVAMVMMNKVGVLLVHWRVGEATKMDWSFAVTRPTVFSTFRY